MPSQKLTPTFCMEDMYTLDMPDTMDIPMVDMPTLDKLFPLISKWTANHPCFLSRTLIRSARIFDFFLSSADLVRNFAATSDVRG